MRVIWVFRVKWVKEKYSKYPIYPKYPGKKTIFLDTMLPDFKSEK